MSKEGALLHRENSPTAANASNRLFKPSGVISYRVTIAGPMGMTNVDVDAASGDDAAVAALDKYPGAKVARVEPAPQKKAA